MAAGGVACIGYTGEDYALPGFNALALETNDPQEFLDLFGTLHGNPAAEQALRKAGRATAQHYIWSQVVRRNLLPRLRLIAGVPDLSTTAHNEPARKSRMRLHITGQQTKIPPHLMNWIAERLENLDGTHDGILQARVTLTRQAHRKHCCEEARVELSLDKRTLCITQAGKTPFEAVCAALKAIEGKLHQAQADERHEHAYGCVGN
jgi:ribosome-associated translation inhibitor RaiA